MPEIDLPEPYEAPNWGSKLNLAVQTVNEAVDGIPLAAQTPGSDLRVSLESFLVLRGHTDVNQATPFMEFTNSGPASTWHLTTAPGFSAPYIIGIGKDTAMSSGSAFIISNKAQGIGQTIHQQSTVTGAASYALYLHLQSTEAPGLVIEQNIAGAATGLIVRVAVGSVPTSTQKLAQFVYQPGNVLAGDISAYDGTFRWIAPISLRGATQAHSTLTVKNDTGAGGPAQFIITDPGDVGFQVARMEASVHQDDKSNVSYRFFRPAGGVNFYGWRFFTDANIFRIQGASSAAMGAHTWNPIINMTGASLAFYGASPVPRAAAITQTYSTVSRTVAAMTAVTTGMTAVDTTPSTTGAYGYTQVQADALVALVNLLRTAVVAIISTDLPGAKNNLNSLIDDLQAIGVNQ